MHKAKFVKDNQLCHSSEHYIQFKKAELINDEVTANRILNSTSPFEAKKLSRRIKNFDMDQWRAGAQPVAVEGVYQKFSQNKYLLKMLESAKRQVFD